MKYFVFEILPTSCTSLANKHWLYTYCGIDKIVRLKIKSKSVVKKALNVFQDYNFQEQQTLLEELNGQAKNIKEGLGS